MHLVVSDPFLLFDSSLFSCARPFPAFIIRYPTNAQQPEDWMERIVNLTFVSRHEAGGHFPAQNLPEDYVGDLRDFFGGL